MHLSRIFFITALLFGPALACASPIEVFDQGPLARIYGLPVPRDGTLTPVAQSEVGLRADLTNNFAVQWTDSEVLYLDGESLETTLVLRRGLRVGSRQFEIGAEVPWVEYSSGVLDSVIDGWHELFHLPDGGRDRVPSDQLLLVYMRNGQDELRLDHRAHGIGDVRLQLASPLSGSARTPRASALYVSLSVPTGDPDELLGSGAFSFSSWISGRRRTGVKDWPVTLHGTLGGTLIEHVGVLADMRNPFVGIASGGFQWHLTPTVAVGADFNFHSPLYRASELSSLTSSALAVAFGGSVRLGKTGQLELALVEDLDNSTSPDVTIHAALSWSH